MREGSSANSSESPFLPPPPGPFSASASSSTATADKKSSRGTVRDECEPLLGGIAQVQAVAAENIAKIVERGDRLESLADASHGLQAVAGLFRRKAATVRKGAWCSSLAVPSKRSLYVVAVCLLIFGKASKFVLLACWFLVRRQNLFCWLVDFW